MYKVKKQLNEAVHLGYNHIGLMTDLGLNTCMDKYVAREVYEHIKVNAH